jgi:hypothetical protein
LPVAGVEVQWVVVRGVVIPFQDYLLAADFEQRAWVASHPGGDMFFVRHEEAEITGSRDEGRSHTEVQGGVEDEAAPKKQGSWACCGAENDL